MKKTDEKGMHDGHRKRLVDLALNAGVDNMSDIQVMELFLTYIFPRGDVNPIAHRLLSEFESFTHVVDADISELVKIPGLNERSAKKISLFGELFYHYTTARMSKKFKVSCKAEIIYIVEDNLRFRNTENMLLLAISAGSIITHKRRINKNNSAQVGISALDLTNFLTSAKPASLVIAHCHPYGSAVPSEGDNQAFDMVENICRTCGVDLIDSYILGEDGVFSQKDSKFVRTYCDIDQLKTAFRN